MFKSIAKASLIMAIATVSFGTTGCSSDKITQCNSINKVLKELKTSTDALAKETETTNATSNKGSQLIIRMAANYQELSKKIRSLDLEDEKLKGFQLSLSAMYEGYGKSLVQSAAAAKAKDLKSFDKISADIDAAVAKEKTLTKKVAEYCPEK